MRRFPVLLIPFLPMLILTGCASRAGHLRSGQVARSSGDAVARCSDQTAVAFTHLSRGRFNMLAAEHALPLFWRDDDDPVLEPDDLAVLWGWPDSSREHWIDARGFTPAFAEACRALVADASSRAPGEAGGATGASSGASGETLSSAPQRRGAEVREDPGTGTGTNSDSVQRGAVPGADPEARRLALVRAELEQARPTLISTDLRGAPEDDRALVGHIQKVADLIEAIFLEQRGAARYQAAIPAADAASRALFHRNQGPWCEQPKTRDEVACNAVSSLPPRVSGLYPAALQADRGFCEALQARADGARLMDPFTVVRAEAAGGLEAVPYTQAYSAEMGQIAEELSAAARDLRDPGEGALRAYLEAAAQAFRTNDWTPADEAWTRMSVHNSRWYLRVAPDETYFEPCDQKAGFQVSFARINRGSLEWQARLEPVKADLERAMADLAGPPYAARAVSFQLPDFIDIVLNAGDARSATGGSIGQSLPNFGPVADEGRGRTVAMTNLGTDPDSQAQGRAMAAALFCDATMPYFTADPEPLLVSTVLHEAAHNLGPAAGYLVDGETSSRIFGGPLASLLEELKAQTAALYFTDWLVERRLADERLARRAHIQDMAWVFHNISGGMYEGGEPRTYAQLSAIQLGYLLEGGGLIWRGEQLAANGRERGCFDVDFGRFPAAVKTMAADVLGAMARGDRENAGNLVKKYVDGAGPAAQLHPIIAERLLRFPRASYVYELRR